MAFPLMRPPSERLAGADPLAMLELGITEDSSFAELGTIFKDYIRQNVDKPYSLKKLRTLPELSSLGATLSQHCYNPAMIAALLWCRSQFCEETGMDEPRYGVSTSRSLACEVVAIDSLSGLNENDLIQYLCYEVPSEDDPSNGGDEESVLSETAPVGTGMFPTHEFAPGYAGLNALEIAVVVEAKTFLGMKIVQRVIDGIWSGRIVFWESLIVTGRKKPHLYNPKKADPFCRLRVPRYQKAFEALFSVILLILYFGVLIERNPSRLTGTEVCLLACFIAFAYDEFSQWQDAGTLFYVADFWSWMDLSIIALFLGHFICRIIGLAKGSAEIIDNSFDILSLAALILVPRMCSLLSLHPYFGILIPCLKQMAKDFIKFSVLIVVLYLGFLSTFSILGRDNFTLGQMSNIMARVFFGASGVGFDAMKDISPILGPPLMLIFLVLTNILLITSVISLLSNSLTAMLNNAQQEYLFA